MAHYRTQPAHTGGAQPARRHRRRKRRRTPILLLLGLLLLIAAGLFAGIRIFFNIETIDVTGDKLYTSAQVIEASGIGMGQNLLTVSPKRTAARICAALPMVYSAEVRLQPTSRVVIILHADQRAGYVKWSGKDVVVDPEMKILEIPDSPAGEKGLPEIKGISLSDAVCAPGLTLITSSVASVGSAASGASQQSLSPPGVSSGSAAASTVSPSVSSAVQVLQNLRTAGFALADLNTIDVSDVYEISVRYQNRVTILLGTTNNLIYKLRMAKNIIDKQLVRADKGNLDVSDVGSADSTGADRAYFEPQ